MAPPARGAEPAGADPAAADSERKGATNSKTPPAPTQLEPVIVTSQKRAESLQSVPLSVNVIARRT